MILVYALTQANNVGWGSARTIGLLIVSGGAARRLRLHREALALAAGPALLLPLPHADRAPTSSASGSGRSCSACSSCSRCTCSRSWATRRSRPASAYLSVALTAVVASGAAQALVTRIGVKPVLAIGNLVLVAGLFLFTFISVDGAYWVDLFPGFLLVGIGLGFAFVPVSIAALAGIKPFEAGLASGLINTSQQIGGALGRGHPHHRGDQPGRPPALERRVPRRGLHQRLQRGVLGGRGLRRGRTSCSPCWSCAARSCVATPEGVAGLDVGLARRAGGPLA